MKMNWPHKHVSVELPPSAVNRSAAEMVDIINQQLYGDSNCPAPRQTFRQWLSMWHWRVSDAIQVLRGRAEIC